MIRRVKVTNEQMKGTKCSQVGLDQQQNEYHKEPGSCGSGNPPTPFLKIQTTQMQGPAKAKHCPLISWLCAAQSVWIAARVN